MPSSPDSSSDSSTGGSPHNQYDGPNIEAENCLPGVVSTSKIFISTVEHLVNCRFRSPLPISM